MQEMHKLFFFTFYSLVVTLDKITCSKAQMCIRVLRRQKSSDEFQHII